MAAQERAERAREGMIRNSESIRASGRGRGRRFGRGRGGYGRGFGRGTGRFGRGYSGRGSSSYGYQGRGYSGYSGYSSGFSQGQGQGRGQVRSYDGNNYGPPAQRQRTNDGGYVNGGGHRATFNPARGRGGYAFRNRNPGRGRVGSGAYHTDHYHVQEGDGNIAPTSSGDSGDDFQEPVSQGHHDDDYPHEPDVQPDDHYHFDDEGMDFQEEYYGDY